MKPRRIIITRDNTAAGDVAKWPPYAVVWGLTYWHGRRCDESKSHTMTAKDFKKLYGFLPRKGTKAVYELVPDAAEPQKG